MNTLPGFTAYVQAKESDEHYTPKYLFDALGLEFDIDVAAPIGGPPFTPCKTWYDTQTDGLASPWHGLVFMNPPYSAMTPWVHKWLEHGNGIALLPFALSKWMNTLSASCATMLILPHNFAFVRPGGAKRTINYLTGLWAVGDEAKQALQQSGLGKVRT